MKPFKQKSIALFAVFASSSVFCMTSCNNSKIEKFDRNIDFNFDWKFQLKGHDAIDVDLPYDYSIVQDFSTESEAEVGYTQGGEATYTKTFHLDNFGGNHVVIDFDGIYNLSKIYVNDNYLGENLYGYNPFSFDITKYVQPNADNTIKVITNNDMPNSRYYSGSGIYRNVKLSILNPVHIAHHGTYVTTPRIKYGEGIVNAQLAIKNETEGAKKITIKSTIYNSNDEVVSETVKTDVNGIEGNSTRNVDVILNVDNPLLWSDTSPNLYYLRSELYDGNTLVDDYTTRFGFRYFEFNERGFVINGKSVKLKGASMHHDQGALGANGYIDAYRRQIQKLKDMGFNAIRTTHNMFDSEYLRLCDEMGIYVMEEAFDMWRVSKHGNINDFASHFDTKLAEDNQIINGNKDMTWSEFTIKEMVNRDKNNPGIILWSIGNEISSAEKHVEAAKDLIKWVQEIDKTRPITMGDNGRTTNPDTYEGQVLHAIHDAGGVIGYNYPRDGQFEDAFNVFGSVFASESVSALNSRGQYKGKTVINGADPSKSYDQIGMASSGWQKGDHQRDLYDYNITSYDRNWSSTTHNRNIKEMLTKDYVAGQFVWTGFDYIGEPMPWNNYNPGEAVPGLGAAPNTSYFGIIDTAGFPKDIYYLYQSQYRHDITTLNLVGSFNPENMFTSELADYNGMTPVAVYSNAFTVKLYLTDKEVPVETTDLIASANRTVNVTPAGHTYLTYEGKVEEKGEGRCKYLGKDDVINSDPYFTEYYARGADLYSHFYVKPEAGKKLVAKAFDAMGKEIIHVNGLTTLKAPDAAHDMVVDISKTELMANAHSLSYLEVTLTDANGNYVNTANTSIFDIKVEGQGVIAGVDNGREAEKEKFQRTISPTHKEAYIKDYAGKFVVIIKSTRQAGDIKVTIKDRNNNIQSQTINLKSV